MEYVDGFIAAVPNLNKQKYIQHTKDSIAVFKEYGATRVVVCWGEDVPPGEVTSFPKAVQCKDDETVAFSWITWPSKEIRDVAWEKLFADPRMNDENNPLPLDGTRLIYGGFEIVLNE